VPALESKRLEVLQLLRDYRAYHTPFGAAMMLEDTHIAEASYGPAAYIYAGQELTKEQRKDLAPSYKLLEHAITLLKAEGQLGFTCWLMLLTPYLGSEADPSVVQVWSARGDHRKEYHDKGVERLAYFLRHERLYPVWASRMTSNEEEQIDRRNTELYAVYNTLRAEGNRKTESVKKAAAICGYAERRAWDIVGAREPKQEQQSFSDATADDGTAS